MSNIKHNRTGDFTYRSWRSMRNRCTNKNNPDYYLYGARGITVCERWDSFENFVIDMGDRPEGTSIDRIDSLGNYTPSNCKWSTPHQQTSNISSNNETVGVAFHSRDKKWQAYITNKGSRKYLGSFNNKNDAIIARVMAEEEMCLSV